MNEKYSIIRRIRRLQRHIESIQVLKTDNETDDAIQSAETKAQALLIMVSSFRANTVEFISDKLVILSQISCSVLQIAKTAAEQSIHKVLTKISELIKDIRSVFVSQYTTALLSDA